MDTYTDQAKSSGVTLKPSRNTNKSKQFSRETQSALAHGMMIIFDDFSQHKEKNPTSPDVRALVHQLQAYISEHFYTCIPEILKTLGTAYESDSEFTKNIDEAGGEGPAKFIEKAIAIYCNH